MQYIYRRTHIPKGDFRLQKQFGVGVLLKISAYFQNNFPKNTYGELLLIFVDLMMYFGRSD